jgi:hypothetical protein
LNPFWLSPSAGSGQATHRRCEVEASGHNAPPTLPLRGAAGCCSCIGTACRAQLPVIAACNPRTAASPSLLDFYRTGIHLGRMSRLTSSACLRRGAGEPTARLGSGVPRNKEATTAGNDALLLVTDTSSGWRRDRNELGRGGCDQAAEAAAAARSLSQSACPHAQTGSLRGGPLVAACLQYSLQ